MTMPGQEKDAASFALQSLILPLQRRVSVPLEALINA